MNKEKKKKKRTLKKAVGGSWSCVEKEMLIGYYKVCKWKSNDNYNENYKKNTGKLHLENKRNERITIE